MVATWTAAGRLVDVTWLRLPSDCRNTSVVHREAEDGRDITTGGFILSHGAELHTVSQFLGERYLGLDSRRLCVRPCSTIHDSPRYRAYTPVNSSSIRGRLSPTEFLRSR